MSYAQNLKKIITSFGKLLIIDRAVARQVIEIWHWKQQRKLEKHTGIKSHYLRRNTPLL